MARKKRLTVLDVNVYHFIRYYKYEHNGNSPSYREIGEAVDTPSTSVILNCLKKLEEANYLRLNHGVERSIEVIGTRFNDRYFEMRYPHVGDEVIDTRKET